MPPGSGRQGRGADTGDGLDVLAGIAQMRAALRPGRSIRLVGLSGVGKTRFAQALFDTNVGVEALDPSLAFYADAGQGCDPPAIAMATYLIQARIPAILIIDNCSAELHGNLTRLCCVEGSTVGVLTIEYDIRDDLPTGTDTFMLGDASPELVATLVVRRYKSISAVDARTIGEFSGGNARVGLALAHTLQVGESLAGLLDEDLLLRLFVQRNPDDKGLLAAAEACALLYSFDGATAEGTEAELPRLATLAGCSVIQLHRYIVELQDRGLIQARARWRALLPHAIANRLADRALRFIPLGLIETQIGPATPERLFRSFSRRLGYLDKVPAAVCLVERWMSDPKLLGDVGNLAPLGLEILRNIAPVIPERVLAVLEEACVQGSLSALPDRQRWDFALLARHIGYEATLFERCATLLVGLAQLNDSDNRVENVADLLASMFSPVLSGTLASPAQRFAVMEALLQSDAAWIVSLGSKALSVALESVHFSSSHSFEFGARSRGYGFQPKSLTEQTAWFSAAVALAVRVGLLNCPGAAAARFVLASKFAALWFHAEIQEDLEQAVLTIAKRGFWEDGWIAAREAAWRAVERADINAPRIAALRDALAPSGFDELVKVHVLREGSWLLDTEDTAEGIQSSMSRADDLAADLGRWGADELAQLGAMLPDLITQGSGRQFQFARGLGEAAADPLALWGRIIDCAGSLGDQAGTAALIGFLISWKNREPENVELALEEAVSEPALTRLFPAIQIPLGLSAAAIARLRRSISLRAAPAKSYDLLRDPGYWSSVPASEPAAILEDVATLPDGWVVLGEILQFLFQSREVPDPAKPTLALLGRRLLLQTDFASASGGRRAYQLAVIAAVSLQGDDARPDAKSICQALLATLPRIFMLMHDYGDLLMALFKVQPDVALEVFLKESRFRDNFHFAAADDLTEAWQRHRHNPITAVPDNRVVSWCDLDPAENYLAAAACVPLTETAQSGHTTWSRIALELLRRAPDPHSSVCGAWWRDSSRAAGVAPCQQSLKHASALLNELDSWTVPGICRPGQQVNDVESWPSLRKQGRGK